MFREKSSSFMGHSTDLLGFYRPYITHVSLRWVTSQAYDMQRQWAVCVVANQSYAHFCSLCTLPLSQILTIVCRRLSVVTEEWRNLSLKYKIYIRKHDTHPLVFVLSSVSMNSYQWRVAVCACPWRHRIQGASWRHQLFLHQISLSLAKSIDHCMTSVCCWVYIVTW